MKTMYNFPLCRPRDLENGDFISLSTASMHLFQRPAAVEGQARPVWSLAAPDSAPATSQTATAAPE